MNIYNCVPDRNFPQALSAFSLGSSEHLKSLVRALEAKSISCIN